MKAIFKKRRRFYTGEAVAYIPKWARGDLRHPDVRRGIVVSSSEHTVYVRLENVQSGAYGYDPIDLIAQPQG